MTQRHFLLKTLLIFVFSGIVFSAMAAQQFVAFQPAPDEWQL